MRTVYICVSEDGKKDMYILNRSYSHEQITEAVRLNRFSGGNLETVLKEGIYLQEDFETMFNREGTIVEILTFGFNVTVYPAKDIITVHPDASYDVKHCSNMLDKIKDFFKRIAR